MPFDTSNIWVFKIFEKYLLVLVVAESFLSHFHQGGPQRNFLPVQEREALLHIHGIICKQKRMEIYSKNYSNDLEFTTAFRFSINALHGDL